MKKFVISISIFCALAVAVGLIFFFVLRGDDNLKIELQTEQQSGCSDLRGEGDYDDGDLVTIEAVPNVGYNFLHWTYNDQTITENPYRFTITNDNSGTYTAVFEQIEYSVDHTYSTITIKRNGENLTDLDTVHYGDVLEIICEPTDGFIVNTFIVNGATQLTSNTYSVTGDVSFIYSEVEAVDITLVVDGESNTYQLAKNETLSLALAKAKLPYTEYNTCGFFTDGQFITDVDADSYVLTRNATFYTKNATIDNLEITHYDGDTEYGVRVSGTAPDTLVIPKKADQVHEITYVDEYAFSNSNVKNVTLPNSIINIRRGAFNSCNNLSVINFPMGLETIGESAFSGTNLYDVLLQRNVVSIWNGAFWNCENIRYFGVAAENTVYDSRANGIFEKQSNTLLFGSKNLTEIPDTVTSIASGAYYGSGVENVTIPSQVTSIGEYAFYGCKSLTEVNFEDGSDLTIAGNVFNGCSSLKQITIPSRVTSIGEHAFRNITLDEIIIESQSIYNLIDEDYLDTLSLVMVYSDTEVAYRVGKITVLKSLVDAQGNDYLEGFQRSLSTDGLYYSYTME